MQDNLVTINSPHDYQESYRILSKKIKECMRMDIGYGSNIAVESNLEAHNNIGQIRVYLDNWMFGENYLIAVDMVPHGNGSKVMIYRRTTLFYNEEEINNIKRWLGGDDKC